MWTAQCLVPKADLNADVCEECFEADKQGGAGRKHRWPHITLNPEPVVAYQIIPHLLSPCAWRRTAYGARTERGRSGRRAERRREVGWVSLTTKG